MKNETLQFLDALFVTEELGRLSNQDFEEQG